jgi:hypothetical protein
MTITSTTSGMPQRRAEGPAFLGYGKSHGDHQFAVEQRAINAVNPRAPRRRLAAC